MPRRYQRGRVTAFDDDMVRREEERKERFLESLSSELSKLPINAATPPSLQAPSAANPPSPSGLPDHDHSRSGQGGSFLGDATKLITGRGKWQWDVSSKLGVNVFPDVRLHVKGPPSVVNAMRPTGGGSGGAGPDWTPSTGASLSDCVDDPITVNTDPAGDGDWIISSTTSSSAGSVNFTVIPDPGTDNNWFLRYRYQKTLAASGNVTWTLKQGVTVIESWTDTPDPGNSMAVIPVSHAFSAVNIANIVFPLITPLHMEMTPGGAASQQAKLFVWFLEVPGGGGSGDEDIVKIEGGAGQAHDWLQLLLSDGLTHFGLRLSPSLVNHSWVLPATQGAANSFLKNDGAGNLSWDTSVAPSPHNILSPTHGDTLTDTVVAGDIIIGNATPKWARLAKGTNGQVLTLVAGLPAWATPAATTNALLDGTNHIDTVAQAVSRGSMIYGNATPKWDELVVGAADQIMQTDGTDVAWTDPLRLGPTAYNTNTPLPATPAANKVRLFADSMGTAGARLNPAFIREEGRGQWLQGQMGWNSGYCIIPASGTNPDIHGTSIGATAGTISHPSCASTNLFTSSRHINGTSATPANSNSTMFENLPRLWRGNAAGLGGFYFIARVSWSIDTEDGSGSFCFVGLSNSTVSIAATKPSALTNIIGIGSEPGNANKFQITHNDGTAGSVQADLGTNFTTAHLLQFELFCPVNGSTIYYRVSRLDDKTIAPAVGSFNTRIPANTAFLGFHIYANNGNVGGLPVIWTLYRMYAECDV